MTTTTMPEVDTDLLTILQEAQAARLDAQLVAEWEARS
jgi:hypothetical protein